jgi:hypothetical protein
MHQQQRSPATAQGGGGGPAVQQQQSALIPLNVLHGFKMQTKKYQKSKINLTRFENYTSK